jgi:hypothetical protein
VIEAMRAENIKEVNTVTASEPSVNNLKKQSTGEMQRKYKSGSP